MNKSNLKKQIEDDLPVINKETNESQQYENFRMYHQLQYDRIDKLESKREFFSNLVLTLSSAIFALGFTDIAKSNKVNEVLLPVIIILANFVAVLFILKSRTFIKMHQKRAEKAMKKYAPELSEINEEVGKIDSDKDKFSRFRLYIYLHTSIIISALITICIYRNIHF